MDLIMMSEANTHVAKDLNKTAVAAASFINKFINCYGNRHPTFHTCSLCEAINTACFSTITDQRILLLYFHNEEDKFSDMFCNCLVKTKVIDIIEDYFFLLAWDIANTDYQKVLIDSVSTYLEPKMEKIVKEKQSAIFLICSIENVLVIFTGISGLVEQTDLLATLEGSIKTFNENCHISFELETIRKEISSDNDFDSRTFQQVMFNQLADRDYDCFDENEHEYLKKKIGFSLFGSPPNPKGYYYKQKRQIEQIYEKIISCSDEISQWKNTVLISFIYNCTEPLPNEKLKRSQIYKDYNPNTDIKPFPIYVLKKCEGGKSSCRLFIDTDLRVYQNWSDYITSNTLEKCQMILPKNGRYRGDIKGNVLLEKHLSPACEMDAAILRKLDIARYAASGASSAPSGIIITASILAIVTPDDNVSVESTIGIGTLIYSAVKSGIQFFDRKMYGQNLKFNSPKVRGAYIDIIAGSLGFVGAGANIAVLHLISFGIDICQGARLTRATINSANGANMWRAGSTNSVNSYYQHKVYEKWLTDSDTATSLTIAQLDYSILFFGNVFCGTTEIDTLKTLQDSQRCNRFRRIFDELIAVTNSDATTHFSEIISSIYNFSDTYRIIAILLQSNILFPDENIQFVLQNKKITLNGIIIDVEQFSNRFIDHRIAFCISLPTLPTREKINSVSLYLKNILGVKEFNKNLIINDFTFAATASLVIGMLKDYLQVTIIKIMKKLIDKFVSDKFDYVMVFKILFPKSQCLIVLLKLIMGFFKRKVYDCELNYQVEKQKVELNASFDENEFNTKQKVHPESCERAQQYLEDALNNYVEKMYDINFCVEELHNYCMEWLAMQIYIYVDKNEKFANQKLNQVPKIKCNICNGYRL